jgi:cellobiose phosphorylase
LRLSFSDIRDALRNLTASMAGRRTRQYSDDEAPLRAELFSADQMEQHGRDLAGTHRLRKRRTRDQLLLRLAQNEIVLRDACNLLSSTVKANRRITPAGEWLLDNFYLIEEQIRTARRHLPKRYSGELPRLSRGPSAGFPRVYDIALEAISHGDGRVDPESLDRFVIAYQKTTPLKLGELWAIPIMLRLALIENLRRAAARIAAGAVNRELADQWADRMMEVADSDPKSLILVIADMARSSPPMVSPFVAELARRLQGQSPALALPLTWIEQRLSEEGATIEQMVQLETQSQAASQVSISNSIGSLRSLGALDWRKFVETMSIVELKLREDPAGVYHGMDFATRDHYRHAIEKIAKCSALSEVDVARKAVQLAHEGALPGAGDCGGTETSARAAHVGYYLIDRGRAQLEQAAAVRWSPVEALRNIARRFPLPGYLGLIAALTALFTWSLLVSGAAHGMQGLLLASTGVVVALATSQLAVALVNWLATLTATPQTLPRLDYSGGIPAHCRTLVVVPTMLGSLQGIDDLVEALEVRFLANRDPKLHFGLLTDYLDADTESLPADAALLAHAQMRIEALNQQYRPAGAAAAAATDGEPFFLFHRPRRWNAHERIWMGYERKRGKLAELNAYLRGGARDCFALVTGSTAVLPDIKYVITLDTDTQLPRDAARQFVGTMAHPLNRACFDDGAGNRVVAGYSILQPRVAVSLPRTSLTRYARLFGSEPGIDPYTRAISDVYQDVFGEGSFIGKGIYDVDAFERALKDRFPENRILSHDLLEGCYARAALLSDVQLYEEYPARYSADVARRHRWIRGDWQIASWLLARVPYSGTGAGAGRQRNPLSGLSQWKILDNLRRSLIAIALTALLLTGWLLTAQPWLWTAAVLGIILIPSLSASIVELFRKPDEVLPGQHCAAAMQSLLRHLAQAAFTLACLPYEAWFSLDAIVRTNWRILLSRRRLLQWSPSDETARASADRKRSSLLASYRAMWEAPVTAMVATALLISTKPAALQAAVAVIALWLCAPAVTWWVSRPLQRRAASLSGEQTLFLRKLARRTWAFFETFVGADDHWLPPDNFQEHPAPVIAHRTSPTNIGLALLSNLTAYDFGYIMAGELIERTSNTFATMALLERHRGHFYNWYDTLTLQPLPPLYLSTVDSGNLAAHLLTLRPGLLGLADNAIVCIKVFESLNDTLAIITDAAATLPIAITNRLAQLQRDIDAAIDSRPATLAAVYKRLLLLAATTAEAATAFAADAAASAPGIALPWWSSALARQCRDALVELETLAPWLTLPAAPGRLNALVEAETIPSLRELAHYDTRWLAAIELRAGDGATAEERAWLTALGEQIIIASQAARQRMATIATLAAQAGGYAQVEYGFLYNEARHLLSIGYNTADHRQDSGSYDLLASEARLTTFVAIAQGQLPQESWFALGRLLTNTGGDPILLSWSGSMFEYLMPLLVMPTYENTLLDQTCAAAVARQIAYGKQRGVAWGMSECGYNTVDAARNYQYRAFGVPGLGLKRGLADDLVIAPYASVLALMVEPAAACANLQRLADEGLAGLYGLHEAVDYTPSRLPRGHASVIVRSFMAHHQGMSLLALAYYLLDRPMQQRFESDPQFQATTLLLQERAPRAAAFHLPDIEFSGARVTENTAAIPVRVLNEADTATPEVQLLSNGRYHVMVTNAGGGYSRWKDLAVTRWREDPTCDNWGSFCYIRDVASGMFWSSAHQPTLKRADSYAAIFSEGRAEFRRRDLDYDTHTEIVVSPEDDIELRRVHINNRARTRRTIEITSYAEVVIATAISDALHPAFSNLFVETEIIRERQAILCTRRPRAGDEQPPWMFHLMAVRGAKVENLSFETDRMRFIGRGRSAAAPQAMDGNAALSNSAGAVLDPIVAVRYRIVLEPEQVAIIDMVTGITTSRDDALALAGKYQDRHLADRVFELAWTHSQVVLRQINASEDDTQLYGRLASPVIYADRGLRADAATISRNRRGQSGLWGYAISGDLPIVLLQIGELANIDLVRQLVQAHAYWRLKGLSVDLVIWNEEHAGYRQQLQEQIMGLIAAGVEAHVMDKPGGIFVRRAEQISDEDRVLVQAVARVIISDRRGALIEQISRRDFVERRSPRADAGARRGSNERRIARLVPGKPYRRETPQVSVLPPRELLFDNGLGGFTPDGREYVITTAHGSVTPAPWVNVLANAQFGTVVSENGMAYTWSENAHEFRLTPWSNDPVSDAGGEAFYLRDNDSGYFWSPAPLPRRGSTPYVTRHGFGYSSFEHSEGGITSELTVYVALADAVKYSVLKVHNHSGRARHLSATGYVEWVLGDLRPKSTMHVVTEIDAVSGALLARNAYNNEFADRVAFFEVDDGSRSFSGDRGEFIGRNGSLRNPAAMGRVRLSNNAGAALDPCAALQVAFELEDGEEREFVFRLGAAGNLDEARKLLQRGRGVAAAHEVLGRVLQYWQHTLGAVQVETPDPSLNVLANGWLLYQTLACRLWGRSGFYQSGGAFGFRDQLQDVMALVHAEPALTREHLLRCAAHQFNEGDVQHWWHPPSNRGVRTRGSDDFLWLPLAICRYVGVTGDHAVLDTALPFLDGRAVNADEESYYDLPGRAEDSASLYEHGMRAIIRGLHFGERGLPLMGTGDWNDGMNLVGAHGHGESVWLGFFLYDVLTQYGGIARLRNDSAFAERCTIEAAQLKHNLERNGWDGEWYRRAYFDDGTPLGSAVNSECRIDAIAQSWSVLSGAGDPKRARTAMAAVDRMLVRRDDALIELLTPPFDKSDMNPGYIKGYTPGVRENGGQYTHAAIWTVMAFAKLGDFARAWELFGLINPVHHGASAKTIATYKVEPYVVAADVYAVAPHTGRGGWTWYTGSAGWMYRLIIESLLGLQREVDKLRITPCLPAAWPSFRIHYRFGETLYHIEVVQTDDNDGAVRLDGMLQSDGLIPLADDRLEHAVEVRIARGRDEAAERT